MQNYDDLKKQEFRDRINNRLNNFKWKMKRVGKWMIDNKELVIFVGPAVIGGISFIVKNGVKHINLRKQESVKNTYCYDRSLGHYWKLRRELTNEEWVLIDKRKASGERLADILDELKVLK